MRQVESYIDYVKARRNAAKTEEEKAKWDELIEEALKEELANGQPSN